MTNRWSFFLLSALGLSWASAASSADVAPPAGQVFRLEQDDQALSITAPSGRPFLAYRKQVPQGSPLSVRSAAFFHPFCTPSGKPATDLAPADHLHHRGVFLALVEMHGAADADFWGWGEHAPKEDRQIVVKSVEPLPADLRRRAAFEAHSVWQAGNTTVINETLMAEAFEAEGCNILDLRYTLRPTADTRLPRWAFSGFCLRLPKDGQISYSDPAGPVNRQPPNHLRPELNWPAADWYDATLTAANGEQRGAAVVDHPKNPPSTWHNEPRIHMVNPCFVAPGEVRLKAGEPLVLRYRLIAHDGPTPREAVARLAAEFRAK